MATLDLELDGLAATAAGALVSAATFADLARTVRGVPSVLTRQFGFECPLGTAEGLADLYLRVASRAERQTLATAGLPDHLQEHPAWHHLWRFGRCWLDPRGPLDGLEEIWLEFDVNATRVLDPGVPGVFLLTKRTFDDTGAPTFTPDPDQALAQVAGQLPAAALRSIRLCLAAAPAGAAISFFLGVMPGRRTCAVRVCIRNLAIEQLGPCLEAAAWPGPIDSACNGLAPFARHADRLTLDLDASADGTGPRIGLECGFTPIRGQVAVESLVEALVREGLCVEAKRIELLSWTGRTFDVASGIEPLDDVCGALALAGLRASPALAGRLNHVKISFEKAPFNAKVYLSLDRRWRVRSL